MTGAERLIQGVALALALDADGPLFGALILGPPGAGKTSLALSAIMRCRWERTCLVADDAVLIRETPAGFEARAPESIYGRAELHGFGPVEIRSRASAVLNAGFDLGAPAARIGDPVFDLLDSRHLLPIYPFRAGSDGATRLFIAARAILGRNGR
jgi:hypothetical protein